MISIATLLAGINTILLVIFGCLYVKKNYVIMTSEEYNTIAQFVEEHSEEAEASQELAGGTGIEVGFGADYLEDEEDE
nr:MAG TPA: hypothetical protein [Caudoviricetes sp.]